MDNNVKRAIELVSEEGPTKMLDEELPRLEQMLRMVKPMTEEYSLVIRALTVIYTQALKMVAAAAKAMGYPPYIDQWPETDPIEAVVELHPVIMGTMWHQKMLMQVIMPVDHIWFVPPTEI